MAKRGKMQKNAEKAIRKTHPLTILLTLVFLLVGIGTGIGLSEFLIRNDKFVLNGEQEIRLSVGEEYIEPGATVISFGKDISDRVLISGDALNTSVVGEYQLVYQVENFRYKHYRRVRTVIVVAAEEKVDG